MEGGAIQFQEILESLENVVLLTGMTHWQVATLALKEYLREYLPIPTDDAR